MVDLINGLKTVSDINVGSRNTKGVSHLFTHTRTMDLRDALYDSYIPNAIKLNV